jgi:hypothetical protein
MRHERIEAHNATGFMYLIFLEAGSESNRAAGRKKK